MTKYIWHTQEDDKVRPWHADRDGEIFDTDDPPEDGNPGEAENCRCWAEPIEEENKDSTTKKLTTIVPDTPLECLQKDEIAIEKAYDILMQDGVEGREESIYYDIKGIPTIGVGTNIEQKSVFMSVNFLHNTTKQPLSIAEKEELYQQVMKSRPDKSAKSPHPKSYSWLQDYIISDSEEYRLATEHLKNDLQTVKNKFAQHGIDYAEVPPSAVTGALEIIYNVGPEKFKQFNHFMEDGIKQRDYIEAYKQSHRENMPNKRYKMIESLYDNAEREMQHKQKSGTWN